MSVSLEVSCFYYKEKGFWVKLWQIFLESDAVILFISCQKFDGLWPFFIHLLSFFVIYHKCYRNGSAHFRQD